MLVRLLVIEGIEEGCAFVLVFSVDGQRIALEEKFKIGFWLRMFFSVFGVLMEERPFVWKAIGQIYLV